MSDRAKLIARRDESIGDASLQAMDALFWDMLDQIDRLTEWQQAAKEAIRQCNERDFKHQQEIADLKKKLEDAPSPGMIKMLKQSIGARK